MRAQGTNRSSHPNSVHTHSQTNPLRRTVNLNVCEHSSSIRSFAIHERRCVSRHPHRRLWFKRYTFVAAAVAFYFIIFATKPNVSILCCWFSQQFHSSYRTCWPIKWSESSCFPFVKFDCIIAWLRLKWIQWVLEYGVKRLWTFSRMYGSYSFLLLIVCQLRDDMALMDSV